MADPMTAMAAVSIGGTIAGGLVQAQGQQDSADAQAAALNYKAGVAGLNKQIADQNANWAMEAGDTKAAISGMKTKAEIGKTLTEQSSSGIDVNSGSGSRVREAQDTIGAFDQNVIRWDASKTAYGYETKAMTDVAEANLDTMAAADVKRAGDIQALGSYLNMGTQVASKWTQGKSSGLFGSSS
jgi:hypothetical protein